MPTALVTGSTGFVGRHLVQALLSRGDAVRCLVRPTSDRAPLLALGASEFALGDVTSLASMVAATRGVDVVYHAAAYLKAPWDPAFRRINADGVGVVAQSCAAQPEPPTLVVVSSMAAAGPALDGRPRLESDPPSPVSTYGRCKLDGERLARKHAARVPTTVVRPPGVFGPGDSVLPQAFTLIRRGLHLVPGDPARQMSMIHVADLARFLLAAADRGERLPAEGGAIGQGVYHVAHPEPTSMAAIGQIAAEAMGVERLWTLRVPDALLLVVAAASEAVGRLRGRPAFLNTDKYREATAGDWVCGVEKAVGLGFAVEAGVDVQVGEVAGAWAEGVQ